MADEKQQPKKKGLFEFKFIKKLKSIKNIQFLLAIALGAIILLIYYSSSQSSTQSETDDFEVVTNYTQTVEQKLQTVLSSIEGAGKVEVMIGFDSGLELVIAYSTETKTTSSNTSNGGKTETTIVVQTPVLITEKGKSEPIVLKEKLPEPKSVVIVASGAKDVKVKLDLIKAAQITLDIPSSKIEVFVGN